MSFEVFISPKKNENEFLDLNKSSLSPSNNDTSAEEVKIDFSDFSNQFDYFSSSLNFSDIITSSTDYNKSISDSNTLLNEITSKLFQSEGNYSTLILFLQQIRTIIFEESTVIPDDETISTTCSTIVEKINKLIDEHLQMKLTLQQFAGMLDKYNKDEDNQSLTTSQLCDEDKISHYTKIIQKAVNNLPNIDNNRENVVNKDLNTIKREISDIIDNKPNPDSPKTELNQYEDQIKELEQKYKQKELRMTKIIQDMKKKLEKLKNQKYITEAGIKRIERQLSNGNEEDSKQEDNSERYDKVVDQIKQLQSKNKKYSKIFSYLQSNLVNEENSETGDDDPISILQAFRELKQENHKLDKLLKSSSFTKSLNEENDRQLEEMNAKMINLEKDLDEYKSALSQIEDILQIDYSNTNLKQKITFLTDLIKSNKEKNDEFGVEITNQQQIIDKIKKGLSQIKTILNIQNPNPEMNEIVTEVNNLKAKYESLKNKHTKLVSQAKQVIQQTKLLKDDLLTTKNKESELQEKFDEQQKANRTLKQINQTLNDKNTVKKKNIIILTQKVQLLTETLEIIKKEFIKFTTNNEDKETIEQTDSVPKAFLIFLSKYNKQVTSKFHCKFNPIINDFDYQIHSLSSQISNVISKYQNLVKQNSKEKNKMETEIKDLKENYLMTLKILFPPFLGIKSVSKSNEIIKYLEKLKTITNSLFLLIPHIKPPNQKESLYCLILALRAILLSSKLSQNLPITFSDDISMTSIKLNESQIRKSIFFQYELRNKELSQKLYQSIRYSDIIDIVGDMIKTKPKIVNEKSVIEMFNALRQKLDKSELDKERLADYKSMVKILLDGLSKKIPSNLKMIVNQLTTFTI